MIGVKLKGGLGNQMFQYAVARRLAHVHNTQVKLDLSFFWNPPSSGIRRTYELHNFAIVAGQLTPDEISVIHSSGREQYSCILFLDRLIAKNSQTLIYNEPFFHFSPRVLTLPDNTYLNGYWQSPRYFSDIEQTIRHEFTCTSALTEKNLEVSEIIAKDVSVSLHIRRGDYVADPHTMNYHGLCPLTYYQAAISVISKYVTKPHFFVFSDDQEWAKENLHISHPATYVDHNGPEHGYEDLRLMSLCDHHIIANSSFSWWGAWLGCNNDKMVIAPQKWFNNKAINMKDLFPASWKQIADV